jgi:hypothetical protein
MNLDLKTKMYLKKMGANIVPISENIEITRINPKDVYVFNNYDEYNGYFSKYLKKVDDSLIELAIYTKGKKGQIVASKGLCERIVIKQRTKEFYDSYDQDKIDRIHFDGQLTPMEKLKETESHDLCAVGDAIGSAANRCRFFENCHDCLAEYYSHEEEYPPFDIKLVNNDIYEKKLKRNN